MRLKFVLENILRRTHKKIPYDTTVAKKGLKTWVITSFVIMSWTQSYKTYKIFSVIYIDKLMRLEHK